MADLQAMSSDTHRTPDCSTTPSRRGALSKSVSDISVVMCTYNGELFVRQQLESILGQHLPPTEIIVADDGSTDGTVDIVESVAKVSEIDIRLYRNPHRLGFSENFLQACSHARGLYIAFSDQDDRWSPRKLEVALNAMVATGTRLSVHRVDKMDSSGARIDGPLQSLPQTGVVHPLRSHPWGNFLGFTMLFERSLLDHLPIDARGKDPHARDAPLSHDRWIYFLATTFGRIVVLEESLADYRQHDRQLYGGLKGRSVSERVATKLAGGREQASYLAEVAAHRARLLESLSPAGVLSDQLAPEFAGARWWRAIESHIDRSARLYVCHGATARVALLFKNVRAGAYRSFQHSGLGLRRFVEDAVVVVLLGLPDRAGRLEEDRAKRSTRSAVLRRKKSG